MEKIIINLGASSNQRQLSHYVNGRKRPTQKTVKKIERSIHKFAKEISQVEFA